MGIGKPKAVEFARGVGMLLATLLILQAGAFASNENYRRVLSNEGFLVDSIIQLVAADITGDGKDEMLLVGRNYEARETFLYVVSLSGGRLQILWKSSNMYESPGHVAVTAGDFMSTGATQVLVMGDEISSIYHWHGSGLQEVWQGRSPWPIQEIASVRGGPGQPDLVALTRVVSKNPQYAPESINVLKWSKSGFTVVAESPAIGVIRALASGVVAGGSVGDLVVDVGQETKSGLVEVWIIRGDKLVRVSSQSLSSSAVFGLTVFSGGSEVVLADDRGKVEVFRWQDGQLRSISSRVSLGWALVSSAAGRFEGNGRKAVVVAEYPNVIHILSPTP